VAPEIDEKEVPLVETCHWTEGVGRPEAAALNDAVEPATTLVLVGWAVMAGAL
jgi:hypothetical protein